MSTEKDIEHIEQSMKSGYISMLILLALEKESANGYKLMKMISEDTFGKWRPTNSTMYPYLSNLTKKGLIQYKTKKTGQRESKEYSLTLKGTKSLKKLIKKQQEITLSIFSMISAVLDEQFLPNQIIEFFKQPLHENILRGKTNEEKINIINKRLEMFDVILDLVGKNKIEMENELKLLKSNKTEK